MAFDLRPQVIGARRPRVEDPPLLRGEATFIADLDPPGVVDVAFVRSTAAHARIADVDLNQAREQPRIVAAFAAADLTAVTEFPQFHAYVKNVHAFPLARDRARYVGAPIAVVVGEDRYAAEDGAEFVDVEYEELPVVASIEDALDARTPLLYESWDDNILVSAPADDATVAPFFDRLPVFEATYRSHRQSASPIETRGVVADYRDERLTVWSSTQSPHILRTTLSAMIGLPESRVRVIAPTIGGGFGLKAHQYPEDIVVPWLAMKLHRPVRWIEDRPEHLVAAAHAREQHMDIAAAYDPDGVIHALRCDLVTDVGSGEIFVPGVATAFVSAACLTGPYRIAAAAVSVSCVVTNKTPSGAYRGFGQPESVFAMERTIEGVAQLAGVDAAEARRRMLVEADEHPYRLPSGGVLDSGSHREAFDRCAELASAELGELRSRTESDPDVRVGVGLAACIEPTVPSYYATTSFWTGYDSTSVRIEPDGSAVVGVGITAIGQGTQTLVTTLLGESLGIPAGHVRVETGDTDQVPYGLGAWGARGAVLVTGGLLEATEKILDKGRRIAAHLLEADVTDVDFAAGRFVVRGATDRFRSLADVATAAVVRTVDLPEGLEPGLAASVNYEPPGLEHVPGEDGKFNAAATWSNASHAAIVQVDLRTGAVQVLGYTVVHDCGRVINPVIVEGQVHGGVAQGIAGALYEQLVYDEIAQPRAATFVDYLVPTGAEIPSVQVDHLESPAPLLPLGAKGMGESGAIGGAAAVSNAVCDALAEFDIDIRETPLTPERVLELIRAGELDRTRE